MVPPRLRRRSGVHVSRPTTAVLSCMDTGYWIYILLHGFYFIIHMRYIDLTKYRVHVIVKVIVINKSQSDKLSFIVP